jgi:protein-S-isoprenylcysteine O-methyltransferase Ste14
MSKTSGKQSSKPSASVISGIFARAGQILIMFILLAVELFVGAGTLLWSWAWVYIGISLLSVAINAIFLLRTSPETVAERGRPKEVKTWDKWIGGGLMVGQYILLPIIAALDYRIGWTGAIAIFWHVLGATAYAFSLAITGWAMISNAYFSTAVRIQSERGQKVCQSGPYRYVRHPGYVGFFLQALSVPILLGSIWALIFTVPIGMLMVIRTSLEDHMLQNELEGYKEYADQVKYRLVPGVW